MDKPLVAAIRKPFDDSFGNYLLHGITEVELPNAVSWWPETLAWKLLGGLILLWLLKRLYHCVQTWKANEYRRQATSGLLEVERQWRENGALLPVQQLPVIMKATALKAFPRTDIASLSNDRWLGLLSSSGKTLNFNSPTGALLLQISYQPVQKWQFSDNDLTKLFTMSRKWVNTHQGERDNQKQPTLWQIVKYAPFSKGLQRD